MVRCTVDAGDPTTVGADTTAGAGGKMDYWDFIKEYSMADSPYSKANAGYRYFYENSHGGWRRALSYVPIFGWQKRVEDEIQYAEDYYRNTGEDPLYMQRYGSRAGADINGIGSPLSQVPRMARSLSRLYPAEIKEDLANAWKDAWRMKRESYYASAQAANAWNDAWKNKR